MSQDFPLAPIESSIGYWLFALIPVLLLALAGVLFWAWWQTRAVTLTVQDDKVVISGGIYGRSIDRDNLELDKAKIIAGNIDANADYKPVKRTNGLGLSNFRSGWFRLANGEKALMFVSDVEHTVYIPTTEGYALIVSPEEPDKFLETLQQ